MQKLIRTIHLQKGQTIIEAVVALVTILLILTAIAVVIVSGLYNSTYIKNQNEANKFAQQGMELVRNIQQNSLSTFKGYVDSAVLYCIDDQTSSLYSQDCTNTGVNTGSSFNRTIEFTKNASECNNSNQATQSLKVNVTVRWSSSKCPADNTYCHKSELVSCMPYIYPGSNP